MKWFKAATLSLLVVLTSASGLIAGEWADLAMKNYWSISVKPRTTGFVDVQVAPDERQRFVYVTYTLENKSGKAIENALPTVALLTDTKKVFFDTGYAKAKAEIERVTQTELLLEKEAAGKFESNKTKQVVSVFPVSDLKAKELTFQFRGLTNHYKMVEKEDGQNKIIKRVREVRYSWPGDTTFIYTRSLTLEESKWAWKEVKLTKLDTELVKEKN